MRRWNGYALHVTETDAERCEEDCPPVFCIARSRTPDTDKDADELDTKNKSPVKNEASVSSCHQVSADADNDGKMEAAGIEPASR